MLLKKGLMLFISVILIVSFFTIIAFANSTIKLIVNGSEIKPDVFVENFAHALQERNGAVARLFLSPEIRGQIKPEIIGPSTPVIKIEIKEVSYSNYYWVYNVKAYYGPYNNNSPTLAFEIDLTVEPERYPDGSAVSSRYFITQLEWIKGKSEFIPN